MKIKFEQKDFELMQKNLQDYLKEKHSDKLEVEVMHKTKGYWRIKGKGVNAILTKSKGFFNFINSKQSDTSIRPHYTIIDDSLENEKHKSLTLYFFRKQVVSGSTDQKLPYSIYLLYDYMRNPEYNLNELFDEVKLVLVLDEHFGDVRYKELRDFINENENISVQMKEFDI